MRWQGRERSSNVEDRRGSRVSGGMKMGGGIGLGGIIIVLVLSLLSGGNPLDILLGSGSLAPNSQVQYEDAAYQESAAEKEQREFIEVVLKDTEDVWNQVFEKELRQQYKEPTLVLYTDAVQSACGYSSAATGPFYCPGDQKVYIDLGFFKELEHKLGAGGDFAQAYVLAHEVGHHVQYLLGVTRQVSEMRSQLSETEYNKISVMMELQADYYAGVWAHYQDSENLLEANDLEEAINATHAIGDDRLQKQSRGYVVPDAFTHGTSEQRARWFTKGYEKGTVRDGDTFNAPDLSVPEWSYAYLQSFKVHPYLLTLSPLMVDFVLGR